MQQEFASAAADFPDPFRLLLRDSVRSTNDEVAEMARHRAPEGLIVLSDSQTAGRGRRGAAWYSAPGESLAFSVLLRPTQPPALWSRLALATGLAVAEALEEFGLQPGIKWPNDVWLDSRKVAGILLEAGPTFVVVGIGLNVNASEFPAEVADVATSMAIVAGRKFHRAEVLGAIVRHLSGRRHQLGADFGDLLAAVRERCVLTGKTVSLTTARGPQNGVVEGIAEGGELLLRTAAGAEKLLQADEVRIL
jgi:BirA family biotin operon repressor/biotin-[acetyl-CoA-carboxylase] ligase